MAPWKAPVPPRPAAVEPLAPSRYKVQFTASAVFHDKLGGDRSLENIRLACHGHNQYLAEHDYEKQAMARHRRSGNRLSEAAVADSLGRLASFRGAG